jgi:RimJ/RimL family protein N-acetyltransferase
MSHDLENWKPRPRPERKILGGRHVRLEPLSAARHVDGLFEACSVADAGERFRYLFDYPPKDRAELQLLLEKAEAAEDPLFFAVIDLASGKVAGRQALMRIEPAHGVIEIGSIYWGPLVARTVGATEAQYLFARYVFEELGYRRYEWKCHNRNEKSKRAALRFGFKFEGVFRQHMVAKGENRDTAWYAIIDREWPSLRTAYEKWLDPVNFDAEGLQKRRLEDCRAEVAGIVDA